MPYVEYLASASTSPYTAQTYARQQTGSFSTQDNSAGATYANGAGLYSFSLSYVNTYAYSAYIGGATSFATETQIYQNGYYNINGRASYRQSEDNPYITAVNFASTTYSASGSWNSALSSLDGEGGATTSTSFSYAIDTSIQSGAGSGTVPYSPSLRDYFVNYKTTLTTLAVNLNKTTEGLSTLFGPLDDSETTYTIIIGTEQPFTFTNIKTIIADQLFWNAEGISATYNIEWLGYAGFGQQRLGLVYTTTDINKDISGYAKVLMETDSYSSTKKREIYSWSGGEFSSEASQSYTLTLDAITTSEVLSTITILDRTHIGIINSFAYGFIKTNTQQAAIMSAGTESTTAQYTSLSKGDVYTLESQYTEFTSYKVSYSYIQQIATTSLYTQYVELVGLNEATSFSVRSSILTTASYTYQNNVYFITNGGEGETQQVKTYYPAPVHTDSQLKIRGEPTTNPDTFYTEKAFFGSFAEPNYVKVYKNYSPADCSLVFLALIALDSESSGYNDTEKNKYPSWISVYNGTFSLNNDIASSNLQSVTINQSSSYLGSGATNVFQTKSYFIGNDTQNATTETTSIAMALQGEATSVSRLRRTFAENLDSAYYYASPAVLLFGSDVVYTYGLQEEAGYNIDGRLMNAYTTARSTFAGSGTSSFPISTSAMSYPMQFKNKIRLDSVFDGNAFNTFETNLQRYGNIIEV